MRGYAQESIHNGLTVCMEDSVSENDGVIIHDGVRPLVSEQLIGDCLAALADHEGCMPVLPMKDTIYQSSDGTKIDHLLERSTLFAGQAPEASGCIRTRRSTGKHRKRSCPSQGERVKLPTAMEWMWR